MLSTQSQIWILYGLFFVSIIFVLFTCCFCRWSDSAHGFRGSLSCCFKNSQMVTWLLYADVARVLFGQHYSQTVIWCFIGSASSDSCLFIQEKQFYVGICLGRFYTNLPGGGAKRSVCTNDSVKDECFLQSLSFTLWMQSGPLRVYLVH